MLKLARAQSGFTLIEALVAVAVFGLLLGGVSTLAVHSLKFVDSYKNDLKAALFAQEGLELVRAARDTNRLNDVGWLNGIKNVGDDPCGQLDRGCYAQLNKANGTVTFLPCGVSPPLSFVTGASGCPFLFYDPIMKMYADAGSEQTSFTRTIQVTEFLGESTLLVRVMITWSTRFGQEKLLVQDTLTDWQ